MTKEEKDLIIINIEQERKNRIDSYRMTELKRLLLQTIPGTTAEVYDLHVRDIIDNKYEVIRILTEDVEVKII